MGQDIHAWGPRHIGGCFGVAVDVGFQAFTFLLLDILQMCQWDSELLGRLKLSEKRSTQLLPIGD